MRAAQLTLNLLPEEPLHEKVILLDNPQFDYYLEQLKVATILSIDLETQVTDHQWQHSENDALCPFRGTIRLIQVALESDYCFIIDLGSEYDRQLNNPTTIKFLEVLKERLFNMECKVIAHNGYFECAWLYFHFGFKIRNLRDTLIMSRMIYGGTTFKVKHNLGALFKKHLGQNLDKSQGKEFDWRLPLTNKQLNYAYHDAALLIDLFHKLSEYIMPNEIFVHDWRRPAYAECDSIPVFAEMAIDGYPIDFELLKKVQDQHQQVYDHLMENEFHEYYPDYITHSDTTKTLVEYLQKNHNLAIEYDYAAIQRMHKDDRPSIKEILSDFMDHPAVTALFRVRKLKKTLDYLHAMELNYFNGCVHTSYTTLASECTGRTSSSSWLTRDNTSGMNIQNPGKRVEDKLCDELAVKFTGEKLTNIRKIFAAPDGYKLVIIDLPQAHYMIATESGDDQTAKAMFKDKIDQHSLVGATVAKGQGYDAKFHDWKYIQDAQSDKDHPDHTQCKKFRKYGKVGNYSQLNGSGSATMDKSNKLGIEANDLIRESWKNTFTGITDLMRQLVKNANYQVYDSGHESPEIAEFFKGVNGKWGLTYGFDKRPLWLPMSDKYGSWKVYPSKCYAQHWLSCEKTIMAIGMIKMQRFFDLNPQYGARFVNMAHDEVNIIAKEEHVSIVAETCNTILYKEFTYYVKDTQVNWDSWEDSIGDNWGDK